MNVIEARDGGIEVYQGERTVKLGVIQLIVQDSEETPISITGYCNPDGKADLIKSLNENILWV